MGTLHKFRAELLSDGAIRANELATIREYVDENGLDLADVKFLVQLQSDAREVCPEFDDLLFPLLKEVLLADGGVSLDEQFYLLKTLCADGRVGPREQRFVAELRAQSKTVSREFNDFCEQVLSGSL